MWPVSQNGRRKGWGRSNICREMAENFPKLKNNIKLQTNKENYFWAHYSKIAEAKDKTLRADRGKKKTHYLSLFFFLLNIYIYIYTHIYMTQHLHFQACIQKYCTMSSQELSKNVGSSTLYNSQKLQTNQMITNRSNMVTSYSGILYSNNT